MLALRAERPTVLAPLLLAEDHSLLALSHEHSHGWGVGSWLGGRVQIAKGTGPAHADPEFTRTVRETTADCALAHVRRASVGAQRLENTHPFRDGRFLFAHNGTVQRFEEHRAALLAAIAPERRERIQGQTDSEHLFQLLLSFLGEGRSLLDLARAAAATVQRVRALPPGPGAEHLLTLLVSDGDRLVACAAGKELFVRATPGELVLASEPIPGGTWERLAPDRVVGVDHRLEPQGWDLDVLIRGP